jgi:anti-sigma factor RsiW
MAEVPQEVCLKSRPDGVYRGEGETYMTCTYPPELEDAQLLAYLDGEADRETAEHLEQCAHCRGRAEHLARFQHHLATSLYRATCPSPVELGEYHLGLLARDHVTALEGHLAECPHCGREVGQLKSYLDELAPELEIRLLDRMREGVRVVIARLANGATGRFPGQPAPSPAFVGVRGSEDKPVVYDADEVQIVLEIQADAEQPGRWAILGLVMGTDARGLVAHVWRASERVGAVPVDELGNFVVPGLAPGRYDLILSGTDVEIHVQELEVGTGARE